MSLNVFGFASIFTPRSCAVINPQSQAREAKLNIFLQTVILFTAILSRRLI